MTPAIEVLHLKKKFVLPLSRRKVVAVDDLSFAVASGGIVGFLGANGAGKTTTLKSILRLIFPDSGTIRILGRDSRDLSLRREIGFLTERPYFYDYLTGREFLLFAARFFNTNESLKAVDSLLEEVGLSAAASRPLRRYSKGMLQRVGIAQALINNPRLLILDEPMSGLDPDGRAEMVNIIKRAHSRGATVLFSTHLLHDVEVLCDRVVMIDKGRLVIESTVSDLLLKQTKGFVLEWQEGAKMNQKIFPTIDVLQNEIDNLRKKGLLIVKVSPERPTLEEVFIKLKRESRV